MIINWADYVDAQVQGGMTLFARADEMLGHDPDALRAKAAEMLADGSEKLGRELARRGLTLGLDLRCAVLLPLALAA